MDNNKNSKLKELLEQIAKLEEENAHLKSKKKYGLVWDLPKDDRLIELEDNIVLLSEVKKRSIHSDKTLPWNYVLEGDNLHSLAVLNHTHSKKIDVIYIDPPYNTGEGEKWAYNNKIVNKDDGYKHSKWISMMDIRLKASRGLLKEDGVLICAIDEHELPRLLLLLEENFKNYHIHTVPIVHNPKGTQYGQFSNIHEYAIFVIPDIPKYNDKNALQIKKDIEKTKEEISKILKSSSDEEVMALIKKYFPEELIDTRSLRNSNKLEGNNSGARAKGKSQTFFPIIIEDNKIIEIGDVCEHNFHPGKATIKKGNQYFIYPIDSKGNERKWMWSKEVAEKNIDLLSIKKLGKDAFDIIRAKEYVTPKSIFIGSRYSASEHGTKLLQKIFPELSKDNQFDYAKSILLVKDCISLFIKDKKDALVLDFFAGSGTTAHAVLEINKDDNGLRRSIMCSTNDEKEPIAEKYTYKRIERAISGYKDGKKDVPGIKANLKYFKTELHPLPRTDGMKSLIAKKMVDTICFENNTFKKTVEEEGFLIFQGSNYSVGIIFDEFKTDKFLKKVSKSSAKFKVYFMSFSAEGFFEELEVNQNIIECRTVPVPLINSIHRIYRDLKA